MSEANNIVFDAYERDGEVEVMFPEVRISAARQTAPSKAPLPREEIAGYDWAPWGQMDNLPSFIRNEIEMIPMAGRALSEAVKMLYGNGLVYFKTADLEDGPEVKRHYSLQVEEWLLRNRIHTYYLPARMVDYVYNYNMFSEFVFNGFGTQITGLFHKPAEFCRLGRQNPSTLKIDKLYFSYEFKNGKRPGKKERRTIPLYDWTNPEGFFKRLGKSRRFSKHSFFPTPGITYYARQYWIGLWRKGGWGEVAKNVPQIVSAMQNNQIRLKYQIIIPETYFEVRNPDWHTYTKEQRDVEFKLLTKKLEGALTGTDNAAKTITTMVKQETGGAMIGEIKIIAIDDKLKEGAWIPDSNTADTQIVSGMGGNPSRIGLQPQGGKMGAGSGSDKREDFNIDITQNTIDQKIILEDLQMVSRINNWGVTFMIDHTHHTTTNQQEDGMAPSSTTTTVQ